MISVTLLILRISCYYFYMDTWYFNWVDKYGLTLGNALFGLRPRKN